MVQESAAVEEQRLTWQKQISEAFTDRSELLSFLGLTARDIGDDPKEADLATAGFRLLVPRPFAARMRRADPHDPLLLQVLATGLETVEVPGYTDDPVREHGAMPAPALLHKYEGRALLIVTGVCAVHCRYCFRRHFPYAENILSPEVVRSVIAYLTSEPTIHEIILSGGDPLATSDDKLSTLIHALATIPHLTRLRVHTRLPIVIPERVTEPLIRALTKTRLRPIMVVHCNHPHEIDEAVTTALSQLARARVTLLNQAVLLKRVNDSASVLAELSEKLIACGVLPYYLHLLDPVRGAAHFEVSREEASRIQESLRAMLPGYLVPRFVSEEPGQPAKTPL